jgi:hypothetical protein
VRWYLSRSGSTEGPLEEAKIIAMIRAGEVAPHAQVCVEGGQAWEALTAHPPFAQAAIGGAPAMSDASLAGAGSSLAPPDARPKASIPPTQAMSFSDAQQAQMASARSNPGASNPRASHPGASSNPSAPAFAGGPPDAGPSFTVPGRSPGAAAPAPSGPTVEAAATSKRLPWILGAGCLLVMLLGGCLGAAGAGFYYLQ